MHNLVHLTLALRTLFDYAGNVARARSRRFLARPVLIILVRFVRAVPGIRLAWFLSRCAVALLKGAVDT
jgi:hypothetical protein